MRAVRFLALLACVSFSATASSAADRVQFKFPDGEGRLEIRVDDRPFAEYVWRDDKIPRPYFRHVQASNGVQATRNLPPIEGKDATDHDTMHPGIWLSFGDLSGADFWRNKATTKTVQVVEDHKGRFTTKLEYRTGEQVICREDREIEIHPTKAGTLIDWTSTFTGDKSFTFGDQEEMGLGVRIATPLAVKSGGTILNSDGLKNEEGAWGKTAKWCDYAGTIEGKPVGICLMPDPGNFRPSWFHIRNTGLMAANPFGQNAFTRGEKSAVTVEPGQKLRLRFGILIHAGDFDPQAAYETWLKQIPE